MTRPRPQPSAPKTDGKVRRLFLVMAFSFGLIWDLLTTFLGSLIILEDAGFIPIGLSLVAVVTVGALNFSTPSLFQNRRRQRANISLLRLTWLAAIAFDFWTSLTCNITAIALKQIPLGVPISLPQLFTRLSVGQMLIVLFVTLLATISPMMISNVRNRNLDAFF